MRGMRVALYHEYFTHWAGSEEVARELHALFPDAPVYTLLVWEGVRRSTFLRDAEVRPSFIQRLPLAGRWYKPYAWLFPLAVEALDVRGFDLVLSSVHGWGKALVTSPGALHVAYCHTPPRYLWDQLPAYGGRGLRRLALEALASLLRVWDVAASRRVDHFLANSTFVAQRIRKYYGREATVVHPPVDTDYFTPGGERGDYFLLVGRLVAYKRPDLAVRACTALGVPLRVIGTGPELPRLRRMAGGSVHFLGWQPREVVREHYRRCRAALLPGVEDFGLVPVEAMACGAPVVAYGGGGALDTVVPGQTGLLFPQPTVEALQEALVRARETPFDDASIRAHALRFGVARFRRQVAGFLRERCGVRDPRLEALAPAPVGEGA